MKNFDALLAIAENVCETYYGIATATGSTTNIVMDASRDLISNYYSKGLIFITSGTYSGQYRKIIRQADGAIVFTPALAGVVAEGDTFILADGNKFQYQRIAHALNIVLRDYDIKDTNESMTYDPSVEYQALPTGVRDVKILEIASELTSPYGYLPIRGWEEKAGNLYIYGGAYASDAGKKLKLTYIRKHGSVSDATDYNAMVYLERVKWTATVWLYRNYFQRIRKDDTILQDLLNEAIVKERTARVEASYKYPLPARSIKTNRWAL